MDLVESIFTNENGELVLSLRSFLLASIVSLILGYIVAKSATLKQTSSKSFITTLAVLPLIVQVIIMIVNGNIGTGIAVMGTFSLVRFRSLQGNAREIVNIFLSMAIGLATGTGYILFGSIFAIIVVTTNLIYLYTNFAEKDKYQRILKITIPETLYEIDLFDDLLVEYAHNHELKQVKTINMGSLYRITYYLDLKSINNIKILVDEIRCRNGNLEVNLGVAQDDKNEL
ncbi:MAG: DUF4956 domain-containing protein [Tenericutes bacterium HGW-Tenericutes-1]|jgi:hypothetical protein|nr:MAG: DUF4956 domain-containing protein [Tenericutes bacterium HGW-Tenericutes-1]